MLRYFPLQSFIFDHYHPSIGIPNRQILALFDKAGLGTAELESIMLNKIGLLTIGYRLNHLIRCKRDDLALVCFSVLGLLDGGRV